MLSRSAVCPGAQLELDGQAAGQYLRSLASTTRNPAGALKISLAIGLPLAAMPIAIISPVRGRASSGRQDAFAGILSGRTARAARSVMGRRQR
jgi:hypothetical protein